MLPIFLKVFLILKAVPAATTMAIELSQLTLAPCLSTPMSYEIKLDLN